MGAETARKVSAFRAFRTQIRDAFGNYRAPYVSIDVLLTWGTTRFAAIPVRHEARQVGASNYTLRRLLTHALNMVTGFSTLPLQLASLIGFAFTLFGVLVLAYVVGRLSPLWNGALWRSRDSGGLNIIGEPCDRKGHARFDGEALVWA